MGAIGAEVVNNLLLLGTGSLAELLLLLIGASGGLSLSRLCPMLVVGRLGVNAVKRYSRSLRRASISNWSCSA